MRHKPPVKPDGRGVFSAGDIEMDLTIPRVLMWQLLVGLVLAAAIWGVFGKVAGYSAVLGSLTCVIPNAFLALRLLLSHRDIGDGALLRAAWIGEIGKLALTVLFFTLVFTLVRPLSAAALFAGFIITQLVTFSGFLMRNEQDTEHSNGS
jgi:ATP synthase protein I